ncbi:MAG TPA: hypothetical protein VM450_19990 [Thermomicrobiales bacterium]|jgi:ABC-type Mn2+/Zn2+ transport system permease subunit|nr:hypothetical protein [Thermomicrobiales bacterium]
MSRVATAAIATLLVVTAALATQPERVPAWQIIGAILLGCLVAILGIYVAVRFREDAP